MVDTPVSQQKKQAEVEQVPDIPNLKTLLQGVEGAPSEVQVEEWKQKHGEVFVSGFSEEELFIFRPVSRLEYVELQKGAAQQEGVDFERTMVDTCLLWCMNKSVLDKKAGTVSTLSEQIMTNSNFMAPAVASVLVMKL